MYIDSGIYSSVRPFQLKPLNLSKAPLILECITSLYHALSQYPFKIKQLPKCHFMVCFHQLRVTKIFPYKVVHLIRVFHHL